MPKKEERAMDDWQPADTAPFNEVVMTKIDDGFGVRNVQPLKRLEGMSLWWFADGGMYTYYTPTHWKPLGEDG